MAHSILHLVYPEKEIYVGSYGFDDERRAVECHLIVPSHSSYTLHPIRYVTAENYVRCLSQAAYLLAERILERQLIPVETPVEQFREAAAKHELKYRHVAMTFHREVPRDEEFCMRLSLKNWREIRRLHDFILFTFTNERTVISGEMSFVYADG